MSISRLSRFAWLGLLLTCLAFVSGRGQTQSSPGTNAAAQTQQSQILFTVVDKDSHFVSALRAEDLRVLENDKPQEIVALRRLEDQPLTLAILIDTSASQERTLPNQKLAADAFVQAIMRPGKDQGAVITFTGELTIQQGLTSDISRLRQAIARAKFVPPPGYIGGGVVVSASPPPSPPQTAARSTAIWDAIVKTANGMFAAESPDARKSIILLSDGEDTFSKAKMSDAILTAFKVNTSVYSIGIGDKYAFGINERALRRLSDQTGGRAVFPKKAQDLEAVFAEIQQELRNQYELTYRSPIGKELRARKVRLEIVNLDLHPRDLKISYQRLNRH